MPEPRYTLTSMFRPRRSPSVVYVQTALLTGARGDDAVLDCTLRKRLAASSAPKLLEKHQLRTRLGQPAGRAAIALPGGVPCSAVDLRHLQTSFGASFHGQRFAKKGAPLWSAVAYAVAHASAMGSDRRSSEALERVVITCDEVARAPREDASAFVSIAAAVCEEFERRKGSGPLPDPDIRAIREWLVWTSQCRRQLANLDKDVLELWRQ